MAGIIAASERPEAPPVGADLRQGKSASRGSGAG